MGGKIDCGSGQCIRVCQVFQKLCLRKILCSLKVTSVGQKKSGFEPMASQARSTAFGDPPSEFRKDLCWNHGYTICLIDSLLALHAVPSINLQDRQASSFLAKSDGKCWTRRFLMAKCCIFEMSLSKQRKLHMHQKNYARKCQKYMNSSHLTKLLAPVVQKPQDKSVH